MTISPTEASRLIHSKSESYLSMMDRDAAPSFLEGVGVRFAPETTVIYFEKDDSGSSRETTPDVAPLPPRPLDQRIVSPPTSPSSAPPSPAESVIPMDPPPRVRREDEEALVATVCSLTLFAAGVFSWFLMNRLGYL